MTVQFTIPGLDKTGRLQFFYHCPSSRFPIRDVLDEQGHGQKTEPHIEKCAENYCVPCYQTNVVGFLKSKERYLFLFTTCKSRDSESYALRDKRFILGYIVKRKALFRNPHWAVQGPTKLYVFEDSYPLNRLVPNTKVSNIRVMKLDSRQTVNVLEHFAGRKSILRDCLGELKRLGTQRRKRARVCG
jgi:hypothetical protein